MPTKLSQHFNREEFACKCCGLSEPSPRLVASLQTLRDMLGVPLIITSGTRCFSHNTAVGGASDSKHLPTGKSELGLRGEHLENATGFSLAADVMIYGVHPVAVLAAAFDIASINGIGLIDLGGGEMAYHFDVRTTTRHAWHQRTDGSRETIREWVQG